MLFPVCRKCNEKTSKTGNYTNMYLSGIRDPEEYDKKYGMMCGIHAGEVTEIIMKERNLYPKDFSKALKKARKAIGREIDRKIMKPLSALKRGYVYRSIFGVFFLLLIIVLIKWLLSLNKWWSWLLILLIAPSTIYTGSQIPREIKSFKSIIATKNNNEFIDKENIFADDRNKNAEISSNKLFNSFFGK